MSFDTGSAGSVNLGSAHGEIVVSMDDAQRQLNRQIGQLERGVTSSFGRIGSNVQDLGMNLTKVLAPVTGFVIAGGLAFAQFDDVLTEIEARTGATAEQMEQVRLTALQMGQDTAFSATQASEGMLELMSSGFSLDETMTALAPVLDLAAAGMLDLGFASDAVTDVLAQFSLGAEDARMVADALAQASGSSSATITDLIQGFANVGPVAANFGLDVRETAAALSVFSENGIKGAQAGTTLKSMLTQMSSDVPKVTEMWDELGVSMFDLEGNVRNFDDIIDDLNVSMEGMSDQERIRVIKTLGGAYGQTGLSALLAADGIDTMLGTMDDATTAADLGAARMDSFKGQVNQLKSSLETLMLHVIGPLVEDYLQPLVEEAVRVLNVFNAWLMLNPELAASLGVILGVLAILGPAIKLLGMVITAVLSPIGLFVAAFGVALKFNLFGIRDALDRVIDGFKMYAKILRMGGSRTRAFQLGLKKAFGQDAIDRITEIGIAVKRFIIDVFDDARSAVMFAGRVIRDIIDGITVLFTGDFKRGMFSGAFEDSAIVDFWFDIRDAIVSVWNAISPIINSIADALDRLLEPFGGLGKALKTFGKILIGVLIPPLGLLMKFGFIFKNLGKIFKGGGKKIGKDIGKMFGSITDKLEIFIPQIAEKLVELGSSFVNWIADIIPRIVIGMFQLGAAFIQSIGPAFREFFPKLGEFIGSIIEFILGDGIPMLLKAGALLVGALILGIIDVVPKLGKALKPFIKGFGKFIIKDFLPGVVGFAKNIRKGLVSGLSKLGTFLWEDALQPALQSLGDWITTGQASTDLGNLATAIKDQLSSALTAIAQGVTMLWDNFLKPAILGVVDWITTGNASTDIGRIATAIKDKLSSALTAIAQGVTMIWDDFLKPAILNTVEWITTGSALHDFEDLARSVKTGLSSAFTTIAKGATMIWENFLKPAILDTVEWISSGQAMTDFVNLVTAIVNGIKDAFIGNKSSGGGGGSSGGFLWVNVVKPMVMDVIEWVGSGQATTDFITLVKAIIQGLSDAFAAYDVAIDWMYVNVVWPLLSDVIKWIGSGQAATDMLTLAGAMMDAMTLAFAAMKTSGDWLWMNVFKPMVMDIIAWFLSGKADADLHNIATELMNGLARSFTLLGEGVVWLWTKVIRPMIISAVAYLASGEASMDFELIANGILNSLTSAFNTVVTGANRLWNDVLHPMILAAISYVKSGKAQADLKVLGESLLEQLKVGLADIAAWADVNIVQPIVTEMELLPGKIETALAALETAFATTFDAIGVMAANLSVSVVAGIASTFNEVIDVINGFIDSYNVAARVLPGVGTISRLAHVSFQKGTPWTGSGPLDQPAGVVENREAVVPAHGMSVTPSPRGLQLNGLIDMLQRTLNKVFEGIDGTLLSSMTGQGGAAPLGAVAGAGGLGGGNDTNLNFMGDIKLMVSDETLRDPEMASRARQFGQEFRAGVLTNDDIMEKVRGKS